MANRNPIQSADTLEKSYLSMETERYSLEIEFISMEKNTFEHVDLPFLYIGTHPSM